MCYLGTFSVKVGLSLYLHRTLLLLGLPPPLDDYVPNEETGDWSLM